MNGISALIRRGLADSFCSPPHEDTFEKKAFYKPGSGLSPDTGSACTLILNFPALRTVRKECLLLSHMVYGIFVIVVQTDRNKGYAQNHMGKCVLWASSGKDEKLTIYLGRAWA